MASSKNKASGKPGAARAAARPGRDARKPGPARKPAATPEPARQTRVPAKASQPSKPTRAAAARPAPRSARPAPAAKPPASRPRRAVPARAAGKPIAEETLRELGGPEAVPGLSEEDQIRAAKYLPRELPKRLFEEERFLFPETYGVNRIRLLVRDPEWVFAYWDVNPEAMKEVARRIGERALALSRLTLRILDPVSGASMDILLPPGARWWYVRTDSARRTYRAELGVTLPTGEFHRLAESNTVVTPRVGPSPERARRRISYPDSSGIPLSAAEAALAADRRTGVAHDPWSEGALEGAASPTQNGGQAGTDKGGASDAFRSGASDAFRR